MKYFHHIVAGRLSRMGTLLVTLTIGLMVFVLILVWVAVTVEKNVPFRELLFSIISPRRFGMSSVYSEVVDAQPNSFQAELDISEIYIKPPMDDAERSIEGNSLRILNWNIERGFHPDELLKYINDLSADIVCLQEVDWANERTNDVDVLEYLAQGTNMAGYFGIEFLEIQTPLRGPKFAGGGVHGNVILSRVHPNRVFRIDLPITYSWDDLSFSSRASIFEKRVGSRFALCAEFSIRDNLFVICSIHLEDKQTSPSGRLSQIRYLMNELKPIIEAGGTVIIAGDMNTNENWLRSITVGDAAIEEFYKPWYKSECQLWEQDFLPATLYSDPFSCKQWTYKIGSIYREKLDWILVSSESNVTDFGMGDFNTSDHKPIWVDIELGS